MSQSDATYPLISYDEAEQGPYYSPNSDSDSQRKSVRSSRSPAHETVHASDQPRVETAEAIGGCATAAAGSGDWPLRPPPPKYETVSTDTDAATMSKLEGKDGTELTWKYLETSRRLEERERDMKKYQETIVLLRSQLEIAERSAAKARFVAERSAADPGEVVDLKDFLKEGDDDGEDDDDSSVDSDMEQRQAEFLKERVAAAFDANDFEEAEKYLREGLRKLALPETEEKLAWNTSLSKVLMLQRKFNDALVTAKDILADFARRDKEVDALGSKGASHGADRAGAHQMAAEMLSRLGGPANLKEAKTHCKRALKLLRNLDGDETQRVGQAQVSAIKNDAIETMASILDAEGETIEAAFYRSLSEGGRGRAGSEPALLRPRAATLPTLTETLALDAAAIDPQKIAIDPELKQMFGLSRAVVNGHIETYGPDSTRVKEAIRYLANQTETTPAIDRFSQWSSLFHDASLLNVRNVFNNTPLHRAIKSSKWEIATMLIARGADVNALNAAKRSPLHLAANFKGGLEFESALSIMVLLLERGADVNLPSGASTGNISGKLEEAGPIPEGCTPLIITVVNNNINAAKILLAYGANPNSQLPDSLLTPLHLAVILRKDDVVELLLRAGADKNIKNSEGRSPVDLAPASSRRLDGTMVVWSDIFNADPSSRRVPQEGEPKSPRTRRARTGFEEPLYLEKHRDRDGLFYEDKLKRADPPQAAPVSYNEKPQDSRDYGYRFEKRSTWAPTRSSIPSTSHPSQDRNLTSYVDDLSDEEKRNRRMSREANFSKLSTEANLWMDIPAWEVPEPRADAPSRTRSKSGKAGLLSDVRRTFFSSERDDSAPKYTGLISKKEKTGGKMKKGSI